MTDELKEDTVKMIERDIRIDEKRISRIFLSSLKVIRIKTKERITESRISFFFFHRGKVIESRISFLLEDIRIDEKIEYPFFFLHSRY